MVSHKPDAEEVAHWIYYESLFYISAMMHLHLGTIFLLKLRFLNTSVFPHNKELGQVLHTSSLKILRNLLRVSVTAFLCGALMVLPATGTGVLADWPAGAIYPVTVSLGINLHR